MYLLRFGARRGHRLYSDKIFKSKASAKKRRKKFAINMIKPFTKIFLYDTIFVPDNGNKIKERRELCQELSVTSALLADPARELAP